MKLFLKQYGLLIGGLIVLFFVYGFHEILFLRPQSMHQWRQTDCLQIAHNYLTDSWNFFSPSIHNLFSDNETTGKTIGEFPLLYYFVAILWKIFGEHEFIFRIITLAYFFVGLYYFYKLLLSLLNNTFWAFSLTLLLFTSPLLVFYSNNFLTNVPALSSVLIGWYCFYSYYKTKSYKSLCLCILFFTLGGLFKMTAYISFVLLGFFYVVDSYRTLIQKKEGKIFVATKTCLVVFLLSLITITVWYSYAHYFTSIHGGKFTFNGLWPIWEMNDGQLQNIIKFIKQIIIHQVFNKYTLMVFIGMLVFLIADFKKLNRFILASIVLLFIGVSLFVLLWFQALDAHDYYVINLIILPLFILVSFVWHLKSNYPRVYNSAVIKISFFIFLVFNVSYATNNIKMRYWGHFNYSDKYPKLFCEKAEIDFWWWTGSQNQLEALNDIEEYNRSIGIKKTDLVVFIPDQGFSTSLYLMNQKGWTSGFGIENYPDTPPEKKIKDKVNNKNLKYLFVGDSTSLEKVYLAPFLSNHVGHYNGINIYKLKE